MGTANTLTHSLTYTDTRLHTHPHAHTRFRGKGDSTGIHSIKLEIATLIENKKMERKICYRSTYT